MIFTQGMSWKFTANQSLTVDNHDDGDDDSDDHLWPYVPLRQCASTDIGRPDQRQEPLVCAHLIISSSIININNLDKDLGVEVLKHFQFIIPHQSSVNEVLPKKYELR